jgi:hypothetical protein
VRPGLRSRRRVGTRGLVVGFKLSVVFGFHGCGGRQIAAEAWPWGLGVSQSSDLSSCQICLLVRLYRCRARLVLNLVRFCNYFED